MQQTQPKKKTYLKVSPEDHAKAVRAKALREGSATNVDEETLLIAEFGKHFGWAAVEAVLIHNSITADTMVNLIMGARKIDAQNTYDMAHAAFIGSLAANSKKPSKSFKDLTKNLVKQMKAEL